MTKSILIASSSRDEVTYRPVADILERRGNQVITYHGDKVVTGEEKINLNISDGELVIGYEGQSIAPQDISAAWYRKVGNITLLDAGPDRAKYMHINDEVRRTHDAIWSLYPEDIWLNSPDKNHRNQRKLGQLLLADELGFVTPETVVSNDWDYIDSSLLSDGQQIVVKMMHGVIAENDRIKGLYTTPLNQMRLDEIRNHTIPFPGTYQPFIEKAREWRVTTVGDSVFSAAIYTDVSAKDDWRKHQTAPNNSVCTVRRRISARRY